MTTSHAPLYTIPNTSLSQDWVDHMRFVMKHGSVGDTYSVYGIHYYEGACYHDNGSHYVKQHYGYSHTLYENRDLIGGR